MTVLNGGGWIDTKINTWASELIDQGFRKNWLLRVDMTWSNGIGHPS